jgi:hypothetical protein
MEIRKFCLPTRPVSVLTQREVFRSITCQPRYRNIQIAGIVTERGAKDPKLWGAKQAQLARKSHKPKRVWDFCAEDIAYSRI